MPRSSSWNWGCPGGCSGNLGSNPPPVGRPPSPPLDSDPRKKYQQSGETDTENSSIANKYEYNWTAFFVSLAVVGVIGGTILAVSKREEV